MPSKYILLSFDLRPYRLFIFLKNKELPTRIWRHVCEKYTYKTFGRRLLTSFRERIQDKLTLANLTFFFFLTYTSQVTQYFEKIQVFQFLRIWSSNLKTFAAQIQKF